MPCWQVNTYSIEFDPKNQGLLAAAVKALGWTLRAPAEGAARVVITDAGQTITIANGQATSTNQAAVNNLRVAYSQAAVAQAAAWAGQKGWAVQRQGQNRITLSK